jgi:hypothetical protein
MDFISRPHFFLLGALLALLSAGCASHGFDNAAYERRLQRAVTALIAAGDADSLATAAEFTHQPAQQWTLLERAAALAPERADLAWLKIMACTRAEGCDPTPFAAALHKLDPGNGAAWGALIYRASKLNQSEAVQRYLAAMGEAQRYDLYWNTRIAHFTNALIKVHVYDARMALLTVTGADSATSVPAFQTFLNACKGDALQDPDRLASCRGIAHALRSGDTYIAELIGTAMVKHVWPEGSAEYTEAAGARRLAHYCMHTAAPLEVAALKHNRDVLEYLSLIESHRTEQELGAAVLSRAGVSSVPPPDWKEAT